MGGYYNNVGPISIENCMDFLIKCGIFINTFKAYDLFEFRFSDAMLAAIGWSCPPSNIITPTFRQSPEAGPTKAKRSKKIPPKCKNRP
jgi:hypothetical protein